MAGNRTLTIVKPDAFGAGKAGKIIAHLEEAGFKLVSARVMDLSTAQELTPPYRISDSAKEETRLARGVFIGIRGVNRIPLF